MCTIRLADQLGKIPVLYRFDHHVLDTGRFELSTNGDAIHAEPQVIELLIFLVANHGRLVSRDELNQAIWQGRIVSDSAISSRIKVARKILGDDGRQQKYIKTIHKKGFKFVANVETGNMDAMPSGDLEHRPVNGSRPSVGVLKFTTQNNSGDSRYFADGVTEDLITTLSKISKLTIIAHPGFPDLEDNTIDASKTGADMIVDYVLYGSVRSDGSQLRISVYLVDTRSGEYLWAQRYDRQNREIFDLQDDITKEIVSALQVELTEGDQALLLSRGTNNIDAWQLTFQGQAAVLEHHQNSVRRGLNQLQNAVQLDDRYALAWGALATGHWKEYLNRGWSESRKKSMELALQASDRAMELEPNNAGILAMRSLIFISLRKFDEAMALADRALYFANSEANTIAIAGITLRYCCQPQRAISHTRKAMELCPIYPAWYPYGIGICYWMINEADLAIQYLEEALEIDPGLSLNYLVLAMLHAETGQQNKARDAVESILRIDPNFSGKTFTESLPFSDPLIQARRDAALKKAGVPE